MRPRSQITRAIERNSPLVVGAASELTTLSKLPSDHCDIVELRLDSLCGQAKEPQIAQVIDFAQSSPLPLLITARGPDEGGQSQWSVADRAAAYRSLLPYASLIDIELRDFPTLSDIIEEARQAEVLVIGSFHHFEKTPSLDFLVAKKLPHLVDVHKFALMANSLADIKTHCSLIDSFSDQKLSIMGMGPLGAAARPLMAQAGSLLNYGFLGDTPTAPNQWPAKLLKAAISV